MIDTHCHLDDPQYADNLPDFLEEQKAGGVEKILVPGVDQSSISSVLRLCDEYPDYLYPALGLHPENVGDDYLEELQHIHTAILMRTTKARPLVAIGEIGLDYHFDTTFRQEQWQTLETQMQWATDLNLPVMIHSRDATADCIDILRQFPKVRGVMHCFSGSREVAEQILALGYYLGIGGVITFKNCKLADTLLHIPLDRLVLETDAPYMAPVPYRGKRNESRWMTQVVERLAQVYQCPAEHINKVTTDNAKLLFGLK